MNFKLVVMCFVLITYDAIVQSAPFVKTREEEIKELVENLHRQYSAFNKEDIYAEIENHHPGYVAEQISEVVTRLNGSSDESVIQHQTLLQDMLLVFNKLKLMMNIPDEVDFYLIQPDQDNLDDNRAYNLPFYDAIDRRVYLGKWGLGWVPSNRLYLLIHELTHIQQHQRLGLLALRNSKEAEVFAQEREADESALNAIKCPVCLQMIEDETYDNQERTAQGYLSKTDIKKYKKQKKSHDMCTAHAADKQTNEDLRKLMPSWSESLFHHKEEERALQRLNLDWEISPLVEDRLSSVQFK